MNVLVEDMNVVWQERLDSLKWIMECEASADMRTSVWMYIEVGRFEVWEYNMWEYKKGKLMLCA